MLSGRSTQYSEDIIESTGFFGDIAVKDFQVQRSIPLQIPVELIKSTLISAMQSLEIELSEVVTNYNKQGIFFVTEIKGTTINGETPLKTLYKKALFALAKNEILPEFETLSSRDLHENRNAVEEQKQLLTEYTQAIRTIKGKKRGTVWSI